ncbi:MAG TPA: hypothetical protein PLA94_16110, partial [Myxococcota bacterium]|nr:hypothetical protein [Myxococcota bacterium]
GPRLAENADGIGLFFVAGTAQPAAQVQATVLFRHQLDAAALSAGPVSLLQQAWGGNYSWNQGIDYHSDDSYEVFGYGITTAGGMRLAVAHSWEVGGGGSTYSHSTNTIQNFEDVELIDGGDGNLELVACDEGGGTLVWMRGSPATWYGGTTTREEELLNAKSGACSTIPSTAKVYTAENGALQSYSSSGSNLTASGNQSGWTANDIESSENGHSLWVVADGAAGIYVALDGQTDRLAATDATRVDASVDSQGRLYVVAVDNGVPVLWWGSPGAMVQATLDPQLASVEDVAVLATSNNDALIAIRGGVTIVYGWAKLP